MKGIDIEFMVEFVSRVGGGGCKHSAAAKPSSENF